MIGEPVQSHDGGAVDVRIGRETGRLAPSAHSSTSCSAPVETSAQILQDVSRTDGPVSLQLVEPDFAAFWCRER